MPQNIEKTTKRKENIESIEPLLSALRTISLANWRSSLNRSKDLENYSKELGTVFSIILSNNRQKNHNLHTNNKVLLIIGSNRGLCGSFNQKVIRLFKDQNLKIDEYSDIFIIGTRLERIFGSIEDMTAKVFVFPDIKEIHNFTQNLMSNYSQNIEHTTFSVIYNKYMGASAHQPTIEIFDPFSMTIGKDPVGENLETIIDTDPIQLFNILVDSYFTFSLERCLLSSLAAESSARYTNMENAAKNVDELTHELNIIIQDHRRGKITSETQELAVSAGLLGN